MENKTGKYFKYAIGEIILVVIGILIALQINNWNESKKDIAFETKMLSELKNALENDIDHFEWMIDRMNKVDSASKVMSQHIIDKSPFIDSLYLVKSGGRFYNLSMGTSFQYNIGPYETIKFSGIDKIRNDSLRNSITDLYDFQLPRVNRLVSWRERDYENEINKLKSFLSPTKVEKHEDHYDYISKLPKNLFLNQEFIVLIKDINTRANNVRRTYKNQLKPMEELVNQINFELNK